MDKLKSVLLYLVERFPRPLSRTEAVKLAYLADVEFFRLYGKTLTEATFHRDYFGPHCQEVPTAMFELNAEGLISIRTYANNYGSVGYEHFRRWEHKDYSYFLPEEEIRVLDFVVEQCRDLNLQGIKDLAYKTPPMAQLEQVETLIGEKLYGEAMDMTTLRPHNSKRPFSRIRKAFKSINLESRGDPEEYAKVTTQEAKELEPYLRRALEAKV